MSRRMPPAALCTSSERPSASASDALKLSPPERVLTLRLANYLGAGAVSDAFFVAFKLPNLFRSLFAEAR